MALIFYVLLIFGLSLAEGRTVRSTASNEDKLVWPKKHHVKATRISLTSHIIESYEIWKTYKQSRVDYNNGTVKSIIKRDKTNLFGTKYDIHPEADEDQSVTTSCYILQGTLKKVLTPDDILPDTDDYEHVDFEIVNNQETLKFTKDDADETSISKNTIWAVYEDDGSNWIPVKYETLEYNIWSGALEKHEIWTFSEFNTSFSIKAALNLDEYDCTENDDRLTTMDSDTVTRDLMFINPEKEEHVNHVFEAFKRDFSRKYVDENEHAIRKSIFKNNMRRIVSTNKRNLGYKLTVNRFADRTPQEMTRHKGLLPRPEGKSGNVPFPYTAEKLNALNKEIPKEYDARMDGLVSDVKNQEDCGSCWTFGTTAAVEGALAKSNGGNLIALSNQAIIDCAWAFGGSGCDGGSDDAAYSWMMEYGLPTVAEYGDYTNTDGECKIYNVTKKYPIRGYTNVTPLSPTALKVALLTYGPLSVSIDASDNFDSYKSGIFYDLLCTQTKLNHEITLVGYGERDGEVFWIVKNSWGPSWGIDGYMYIAARDNNCGITTEPTYVVF